MLSFLTLGNGIACSKRNELIDDKIVIIPKKIANFPYELGAKIK